MVNAADEGDADQIMVQQGAIPTMCKLLGSPDHKVVRVVLEALENTLKKLPPDALQEALQVFHSARATK